MVLLGLTTIKHSSASKEVDGFTLFTHTKSALHIVLLYFFVMSDIFFQVLLTVFDYIKAATTGLIFQ